MLSVVLKASKGKVHCAPQPQALRSAVLRSASQCFAVLRSASQCVGERLSDGLERGLGDLLVAHAGLADDDLAAAVSDYRPRRRNENHATKKPPDGRLEHLVAGAGFEPTASGL